jgi:polysaccharide biosynthesis/export protein
MWIVAVSTVSLSLILVPGLLGQSKSENAKQLRAWSLKSGPGAPHNILPSSEISQSTEAAMFLRIPKLSLDYSLGEGDTLKIKIIGKDGLDESLQSLTISNSGEITLPYLGAIQVAGLSAAQLEEKIASLYAEKQLLKQAEVLVYVTDYKAKPFFITGEVDNPGEYIMSQELTLMEGILMAGGIDPGADSFAYLHRRKSPDGPSVQLAHAAQSPDIGEPGVEVTKIDLRPLKLGGVPKPDILLKKGDVLVIPKRKDMRFYVVGDVKGAGAQEIPPPVERAILVSQAIAQAGGPSRTAKLSKGLLIRYNERNGSREEKTVDFAAILKGKQPDFEIRPNDIIFIPGSNAKTLGYGLLGMVPMGVQQKGMESMRTMKLESKKPLGE